MFSSLLHQLEAYQETHWGIIHHVFVADREGNVVLSPGHNNATASHTGQNIATSPFFEASLREPQVNDFFGFEEKDHYHQLYLQPITQQDGHTVGVLVFEVDINHVKDILVDNVDVERTGHIFLATLEGVEVVASKEER